MSDQHDYVALEWVKGEIADTLKQARQALDAFDEPTHSAQDIAECLECIHQVHGSLQMVEFYGAALLAEETEALALAVQQGRVVDLPEALKLLRQALGQMPLYLTGSTVPAATCRWWCLPLLNDLRSARGESLLSETACSARPCRNCRHWTRRTLAELTPAELPALLRKLRQMLQTALVGLLREQDDETNLGLYGQGLRPP